MFIFTPLENLTNQFFLDEKRTVGFYQFLL